MFLLLHPAFRHPDRSKAKQAVLGGFIGIGAFWIGAASAALMATWGRTNAGHNQHYPVIGFLVPYVLLAVISVLYVRSTPSAH